MPRRRKTAEGPDSRGQDGEEEEEEKGRAANAKKKRSFVDAFIVISDSDGEESKEDSGLQTKRAKQQLDRTKFAAKRKIAQMTEEEQFALALKMSEQEARQVNCQEEEEEELLRKAIAESLNSCQPLDSSSATPQLSVEMLDTQGQSHPAEQEGCGILGGLAPCPDTPCSKGSSHSQSSKADGSGQMDVARSPLVVLRRLSQEIVESSLVSSIIVSPGKNQPLTRSSEKSSSPPKNDSSNVLPSTLREDLISLSPTFGRVPSGSWQLTPRRLFTGPSGSSKAADHKPQEKPLPCSGHSVGEASAGSSAQLLKSCTTEQSGSPRMSGSGTGTKHTQKSRHAAMVCVTTEQAEQNEVSNSSPELCMLNVAEEKHKEEEVRDTVHYYWGIPFCPKGVDPNQYTSVILCQLEVYQKSLKQAQRRLLHKKEFGNPVVPSSSLSQNELGKGEQISRENGVAEDTEDGDPGTQKECESITWLLPSKKRETESPGHNVEEEKNSTSDDEPTTSYCQASQVLSTEGVRGDEEPMQTAQSICMLTPLGSKRSPDIARENSAEEEISVCPETQPSPSEGIEPEREELPSVSKDAPMQAGGDGSAVSEGSDTAADHVPCPLCDRGFPAAEIELHAMYCNGIVGEDAATDSPVLTRGRRESRSKAAGGESSQTSSGSDKCEKCYLCKSLVPLLQYQRHVDNCLQAARQAQGTRRLRSTKVVARHKRGLLSVLELSESKSAGADTGTHIPGIGDQRNPTALPHEDEENAEHSACSLLPPPSAVPPPGSPPPPPPARAGRRRKRKF
ncbi:BRCA1-A complex subunit RAP80 isoform X2 [Phasianus colchicus]|uniref:BRCA1-A complex subunit RAP80 isoform X2 n=1 Tax=Phasianus colchicus TaxID=9054 RepID=UPI00129D5754|nr:BRCA1-A complex subunit RAP80 isoform X2 [Phasianus colchicus]